MAIDLTFAGYAQEQDAAIKAAMDSVLASGLAQSAGVLRYLVALYVLIGFVLFATSNLTGYGFITRVVRGVLVVAVVSGPILYNDNVRTFFFDRLPDSIATTISGSSTQLSSAQQFDTVSAAADALVARVRAQNTGWGASAIGNSIGVWFANGGMQALFSVMAGIWLLGRKLMAIAICIGPWLVVFELFEATRGWVRSWIGILVGLTVFQLGTSILLQVILKGEMALLRRAYTQSGVGADEMVAQLFHVASALATDALTLIALPAICAVGSGAAAAHGAAAMATAGLAGRAFGAGQTAGRSAANLFKRS